MSEAVALLLQGVAAAPPLTPVGLDGRLGCVDAGAEYICDMAKRSKLAVLSTLVNIGASLVPGVVGPFTNGCTRGTGACVPAANKGCSGCPGNAVRLGENGDVLAEVGPPAAGF